MELPIPAPDRCIRCIFKMGSECNSVLGPSCMIEHKKMSAAIKKGLRKKK